MNHSFDRGSPRLRSIGLGLVLGHAACSEATTALTSGGSDGAASSDTSAAAASPESSSGSSSTTDFDPMPGNCCAHDGTAVVVCGSDEVVQACGPLEGCDGATLSCVDGCMRANESRDSIGCEYYAAEMSVTAESGDDVCFAVIVSNAWHSPAHVEVEYDGVAVPLTGSMAVFEGQSLLPRAGDPADGVAPGTAAALLLSGAGCEKVATQDAPLHAALTGAPFRTTGVRPAFRITSDVPVVAHQVNPFMGAASHVTGGSLLLPHFTWGDNYTITSPANPVFNSLTSAFDRPSFSIVASTDDTTVTIKPSIAIEGAEDIPSALANESFEIHLDAGEHAQIVQHDPVDGTIVSADAPVGVWVGSECAYVPDSYAACDHLEQMLPAIRQLGSRYVGAGFMRSELDQPIWRVVGAVDGTELSWTSEVGGPAELDRGESAYVMTRDPFAVSSQDPEHPFYLFSYMSGADYLGAFTGLFSGDPDFAISVPTEQFLSRYVFFVDPTYQALLVLVRGRPAGQEGTTGAFSDVQLTCSGTDATMVVDGWRDVPGGDFQYVQIEWDVELGPSTPVPCAGSNIAQSDGPFAAYVAGVVPYTSITFPAGMGLDPLNDVSIPAG